MLLRTATVIGIAVSTASAAMPDYVRTINNVSYTFIDYSYYAQANTYQTVNSLGRLYVPDNYDSSKQYPLVVFMHGAGEHGTNNTNQVSSHIDNLLKAARNRGFLVYAPQAPYTYYSDDQYNMVQNAVARAATQYNVDTTRIYATGLSMGGGAMKHMMLQYTQLYSAWVPLSSPNGIYPAEAPSVLGEPVWYFHGREDKVTSPVFSDISVTSLVTAYGGTAPSFPTGSGSEVLYQYGSGNGTVRYTQYRDYAHDDNVWNSGAYGKAELYDWMLAQKGTMGALQKGKSVSVNLVTQTVGDERMNPLKVDSTGKTWNNIGRNGTYRAQDVALGFASDTAGAMTDTNIVVTKAFGDIGSNVPANITAYADSAVPKGYWMTKSGQPGELKFTGLTPAAEYDLQVFASIAAANYKGLYSAGGESIVLDASNNLSQFAFFESLIAGADGTITLSISPTGGSTYAVLNAFTLTAVPEPATVCILAAMGPLIRRRGRTNE